MSLVGTILALVFGFFGFAFSLVGIFTWLVGFVGFLMLPFISRATGEFKRLANLPLYFATGMVGRAAIVVSEHNDILWKQMEFDDLGVELINFGDDTKEFEDPDAALHYWMGIPFALADEVHGLLFDPRHAALGRRKSEDKNRNENIVYATDEDYEEYGFTHWYKGVYEFAKDKYELVNLSNVRELVDGGERSEYPARTESFYENSRAPFKSGTSATRFIILLAALIGPFAAMWFIATKLGSGGAGGGSSTVGWNGGILWVLMAGGGMKDYVATLINRGDGGGSDLESGGSDGDGGGSDWKPVLTALGLVIPSVLLLYALVAYIGPLQTAFGIVMAGLGFAFVPLLSILVRPSARISGGLSRLLMNLGMQGYTKPVWKWTQEKYELVEASELETTEHVTWYGLFGNTVGFTFDPDPSSWGAEVVDADRLESTKEVQADGGTTDTNIPPGYRRAPTISRGEGKYGAFVPKRLKDTCYYIDSAIAKARFTDSANGERSLNRLLRAKEDALKDGLSDKHLIMAMGVLGTLSFLSGLWVFFL